MNLLPLIDADVVAFRAASSCERTVGEKKEGNTEPDADYIAIGRLKLIMDKILDNCKASDFKSFLSGVGNFRYDIFPDYKIRRKDKPKPTHLAACREYMVRNYGTTVVDGMEADDAIVINHIPGETVICSNDKDFRSNAVGHHYDFTLKEEKHVGIIHISEAEKNRLFMMQMLMGDSADDIIGPFGFNAIKTTEKYINSMEGETYATIIKEAYKRRWESQAPRWLRLNYRLLKMLNSLEDLETIKKEKASGKYPDFSSKPEGEGEEATAESQGSDPESVSFFRKG